MKKKILTTLLFSMTFAAAALAGDDCSNVCENDYKDCKNVAETSTAKQACEEDLKQCKADCGTSK